MITSISPLFLLLLLLFLLLSKPPDKNNPKKKKKISFPPFFHTSTSTSKSISISLSLFLFLFLSFFQYVIETDTREAIFGLRQFANWPDLFF